MSGTGNSDQGSGSVGVFGKHPGFGDFIGRGVPPALQARLESWLTATLSAVAGSAGENWHTLHDHAPAIGFWIGARVLAESEGRSLRGVILSSHDRVGRRFPLVLVQCPAGAMPPTLAPDDGFHAAAVPALLALLSADVVTTGDLLAALPALPLPAWQQVEGDLFWAVNPVRPAAEMWAELAGADLQRGAQRRSYFWTDARPSISTSTVLGCDGLPDAQALGWLMAGVAPPLDAPEPLAEPASDPASPSEAEAAQDVQIQPEARADPSLDDPFDADLLVVAAAEGAAEEELTGARDVH